MIEILDEYLTTASTPEMKDMIEAAHNCFERIGFGDYQDSFIEILMQVNSADEGQILTSILNETLQIQRNILKQQGVVLTNEANINTHTLFIEGLLDLVDHEDKESLFMITELDADPADVLAELLPHVTTKTPEEFLYEIKSVEAYTITKIKELSTFDENAFSQDDLVTYVGKDKYVESLNKLKEVLVKIQSPISFSEMQLIVLLSSGFDVGYSFKTYADAIGRTIESEAPNIIAAEFLAMCLASEDGHDNPITIISNNIDDYLSDVDKITKVTVAVSDLLLQMQR